MRHIILIGTAVVFGLLGAGGCGAEEDAHMVAEVDEFEGAMGEATDCDLQCYTLEGEYREATSTHPEGDEDCGEAAAYVAEALGYMVCYGGQPMPSVHYEEM